MQTRMLRSVILAACSAATSGAFAQAPAKPASPNRAIRLVLPFSPGGATDIMVRRIGQKMSQAWGKTERIQRAAVVRKSGEGELIPERKRS